MPTRHNNNPRPRNPVARAAILRKGGVHETCRSGERQQQKRELDDAVSAYFTADSNQSEVKPKKTVNRSTPDNSKERSGHLSKERVNNNLNNLACLFVPA